MRNSFNCTIKNTNENDLTLELKSGEIFFVLGANGTGKSSLISRWFNDHHKSAKRISAHRQTWFRSNKLEISSHARDNLEENIRSQDQQAQSRYMQEYANERAGVAIYDLVDADNMLARKIADLVRAGRLKDATKKAQDPSPLQVINELMRLSNMPIEVSIEKTQSIMARREGGMPYSVAELSDGERNAFLISADVLTAPTDSLILIDEPERHLHRSIISPLLSLLFEKRLDCAFVISTHDVMLPLDNPSAKTLLLRACKFQGSKPMHWNADILDKGSGVDDELKRDILGSREKIIFVEGTPQSLDAPLYSLLFPQTSIIPKGNCRSVERAVRELREAADLHWIEVWGIIDNDGRTPDEVAGLKELNIYALKHFSVEALYYHPTIIRKIAERMAKITDADSGLLYDNAITAAVKAVCRQKRHLILCAVERYVRNQVSSGLPSRADMDEKNEIKIKVDLANFRKIEEQKFQTLIEDKNLEELLQHYQLRESGARQAIENSIGLDRNAYPGAVRKLLQDDSDTLNFLRDLFGNLYSQVSG